MNLYKYPERATWSTILKRPTSDLADLEPRVSSILKTVKEKGDTAIQQFTQQVDGVN